MNQITLDMANRIIVAAQDKGLELGLRPLSIAVLDPGGHLIAFQRSDGGSLIRPQIAVAKASGALALGISSRKIGEMAAERPVFFGSISALAQNGIVPAAGGLLVASPSGDLIGAVGVTGDHSDQDEICALAGLAVVGLSALD